MWLEVVTGSSTKWILLARSVSCCLIDCIPRKRSSSASTGSCWACMRAEYSATLSSVHYLLAEWSSDVMDWAAFRSSGGGHSLFAEPWRFSGETRGCSAAAPSRRHAQRCARLRLRGPGGAHPVAERAQLQRPSGLLAERAPSLLADWFRNPVINGQPVFDHFKNLGCQESIEVAYKLLICKSTESLFFSHFSFISRESASV